MQYYRSTVTDKIFNGSDVRVIDDIYGAGSVDKVIADGFLEKIDPPSVVDLLKQNRMALAARRYREIHTNSSLKEAVDAVNKIQKEMKELQKKSK